jgi:hypothetical protein
MPTAIDFTTAGKMTANNAGIVTFAPRGTTYELYLKASGETPELNKPAEARIRVQARKVWTVPSGGNFIQPIFGPPRIIQGRVKHIGDNQIVVHAGATFVVDLPAAETAVDLPNGPIVVGGMVNVTALPGATVEFVSEDVAAAASPVTHTMGAGPGGAKA